MYEDEVPKMDEGVNYKENKVIAEQQWKEEYKAKAIHWCACGKWAYENLSALASYEISSNEQNAFSDKSSFLNRNHSKNSFWRDLIRHTEHDKLILIFF